MTHVLDNTVFNGLISGNSHLGYGSDNVKFFLPGISPFAGIRHFDAACFEELYESIPPGEKKLLKLPEDIALPEAFTVLARFNVYQMLGSGVRQPEVDISGMRDLDDHHVPEMLALAGKTNPGPFSEHTIKFGHFRGIFDGEKLVSMAGRRFHANDFVEISAVCTYPEFAGRGFGGRLISYQINDILSVAERPFLHTMAENESAIRLYRKLGFELRKKFYVYRICRQV